MLGLGLQILPSVRSHSSSIDIMRIPTPDRIQARWLKLERSFEGRRIVQTKIGSKPIENPGFSRHNAKSSGLSNARYSEGYQLEPRVN